MTSTFLSPEEVRELTGYKSKAAQKRWLKARRIPFVESAAGNPKVMVSVMEKWFEKPKATAQFSEARKDRAERLASGLL